MFYADINMEDNRERLVAQDKALHSGKMNMADVLQRSGSHAREHLLEMLNVQHKHFKLTYMEKSYDLSKRRVAELEVLDRVLGGYIRNTTHLCDNDCRGVEEWHIGGATVVIPACLPRRYWCMRETFEWNSELNDPSYEVSAERYWVWQVIANYESYARYGLIGVVTKKFTQST